MSPSSLRFTAVTRHFSRVRVLTDVSGQVSAGETLLVLGANGSGKSTLLRCLAGLLAPESGRVEYREGGVSLEIGERRRRVGYIAPDLTFYEELTTLENLRFFARLKGVPQERAGALLERVGLPPDRAAGALSSGMLQRLRWAWALLASPRLLLLDEPFQNLDPPGEEVARELLAEHLASSADTPGREAGFAVIASPTPLELADVTRELHLG